MEVPLEWKEFEGQYYAGSDESAAVFAMEGTEAYYLSSEEYLENGEMSLASAELVFSMLYNGFVQDDIPAEGFVMGEPQAVRYGNLPMYSCSCHFDMHGYSCSMELILYYDEQADDLIVISFTYTDNTPAELVEDFHEVLESVRRE